MHSTLILVTAAYLLVGTSTATAQMPDATNAESAPAVRQSTEPTVPIERLIAAVAKKSGKLFIVDPRVRADVVLIGHPASELTYPEFLGVLAVYGFVAVEEGPYVRVVPDANARVLPVPTITPRDTRPGAEIVSEVIAVKNISAAQLVPILRPLVPQYGGLVAFPQTNSLIIVDHFDNVRRVEGIVREVDAAGANRPKPPAESTPRSSEGSDK